MALFDKLNKDELLRKVKSATEKAVDQSKNVIDKAKVATKNYTDELKQTESQNKELAATPMEERIKMRPDGVRYCMVNNSGKILDVYDNRAVFTSTHSTSTIVTGLILGASRFQGEKTIYFRDVIAVQHKPSAIVDGYIQLETSAGNMTSSSSAYGGENSIQFAGKELNSEAEIIVAFIRKQLDEIKNPPLGGIVNQVSPIEELKKFKELLDMGIITQEEFDSKKKQLLNL